MSRWTNNPSQVALRQLFGPYEDLVEAKIEKVSIFQGDPAKTEPGKETPLGVSVKLQMLDGPDVTKRIDTIWWLHTEESVKIAKQAWMAVYGYPRTAEGEKEFNTWSDDQDWLVDGDNKVIGEAFANMVGRVVKIKPDIKPNKKSGELQQQIGWYHLD